MIKRHKKILELIELHEISTQQELANILIDNGFNVTQATVSRDIKQLNLVKYSNGKKSYYVERPRIFSEEQERYANVFKESVQSVRISGNLLVIKTLSGSANSAAALLDSFEYHEILGSVAGDDTVIAVIEDESKAEKILNTLNLLLD